ncbi:hypothetical protein ACQ4PT_007767 [Festuca glaucescens]
MSRRFVNLVVKKLSSSRPVFNLHRIDPAGLFHPAGSPKPAVDKSPDPGRLPPAAISFPWNKAEWMCMNFMAFNKDVIAVDYRGRTVAYDGALRTVRNMNVTEYPEESSISITVGNCLYTMSIHHRPPPVVNSFQVLSYGRPLGYCWPEDWNWRPLQPPPLEYHKYVHHLEAPHPCAIRACAVVRDSQIWISTEGAGTYSFDTKTGTWSNAGDWSMPFRGHAEYAPEYGLWFGLSDGSGGDAQLCVGVADLELTPTVCRNLWVDTSDHSQGWIPTVSRILPLGSGKFCLVRLSQKINPAKTVEQLWRNKVHTCAVLAGLEVVKHDDTAGLHMVKHKSKTYRFRGDEVKLL